jgi:hypothetical protein
MAAQTLATAVTVTTTVTTPLDGGVVPLDATATVGGSWGGGQGLTGGVTGVVLAATATPDVAATADLADPTGMLHATATIDVTGQADPITLVVLEALADLTIGVDWTGPRLAKTYPPTVVQDDQPATTDPSSDLERARLAAHPAPPGQQPATPRDANGADIDSLHNLEHRQGSP